MPMVTFEGQDYALEPGENLLTGLERGGAELASSCRSGVCQSCMLKAVSGAVPAAASKGLRETQRVQGLLLACCCVPEDDLVLERPAETRLHESRVLEVRRLNDRTVELRVARPEGLAYFPGQFLNLVRPGNLVRSYSIASVPALDDALHFHIAVFPGGRMSSWASLEATPGDALGLMGPMGSCFYVAGQPEQPLFLFGTGTGLAPLYGILREALAQGHTGPIHLFHGSPVDAGLYLHETLQGLARMYPNVHYHPCTLGPAEREGVLEGDITRISLERCASLAGYRVYLCGNPDIVRVMQRKCFLAGANMRDIFADSFLPAAT